MIANHFIPCRETVFKENITTAMPPPQKSSLLKPNPTNVAL